jgi:hypothetical protein
VPLPDWEVRTAIRPLYAAPDFLDCIEDRDVLHNTSVGGRTLYDHIWQMFADFRCAERPGAGDLRRMMPVEKGIWSMHPPKLRIYGWCPAPHSFVAVTGALESATKSDKSLNDRKRDQVLSFIEANHLGQAVLRGEYLEAFPN